MPQPTPYDRQNSFTLLAQENPSRPYTGADLDEEFNAVKVTLDELLDRVELIQRDDGDLANQSVGPEQLAASLSIGVNPPSAWETGTEYGVVDSVFNNTTLYRCVVAHTSAAAFSTDYDAGYWTALADFNVVAIEDGSITEAKLASGAVTATKIDAGAVTEAKIGSGAVTATKIGAGAVSSAAMGTNSVATVNIQDESVTAPKLGPASLRAIGALTPAADKFAYFTSGTVAALADIVSAARTFLASPTFANVTSKPTTLSGYGITDAAAKSQTAEAFYGVILGSLSNRDYRIVLKATEAGTITETTTRSVSGTATATFKVNTTALGGTANSVSSSEQSQSHSSTNTFAAGDDIVITISSNSSCVDMSFSIKWTRTLV